MERLHDQSLGLGRAHFGAGTAAEAVFSVHLHAELEALEFLADGVLGDEGSRSAGQFLVVHQNGADGRVGADEGALAALDAVFGNPFGDVHGYAALFKRGGAERNQPVGFEGGHGQLIALLSEDRTHHVGDVFRFVVVAAAAAAGARFGLGSVRGIGPFGRNLDFGQGGDGVVHGGEVHVDDLVALAAVGLFDGVLQQRHGLIKGNDFGELEEGGLHDHVDAPAEADFHGDLHRVHVVELDVLAGEGALHGSGQFAAEVFDGVPFGVQHEHAAVLDAFEHVVLMDIGGLVAGDVVGGRFFESVGAIL